MSNKTNRCVLLGVSGGIAAYKSPDLVRRLREHGHQVRVVMTRAAQDFITPLSLAAVSGQPVHTALLDQRAEAAMGHIELARWADVVLIAPASADIIARLAHGLADLALVLSPEIIVIGGGVMQRPDLLQRVSDRLDEILDGYVATPRVTHPHFGQEAGLMGALALAESIASNQ